MDHPRGPVAHFFDEDIPVIQARFASYRRRKSGRTYIVTPGVALSNELQRRESLANCSAWPSGVVAPEDLYETLASAARGQGDLILHARNLRAGIGQGLKSIRPLLVERRSPGRKMLSFDLQCMVEQAPDPASRVMLSDELDRFGVPISKIDWRVGDLEWRTVKRMVEVVSAEFARARLPVPRTNEEVFEGGTLRLPDVAHPTGTTRMSVTPAAGEGDRHCAVHGVAGLYIAGSSIFPTSGHANPTQMIVALAIRLADHLKRELGKPLECATVLERVQTDEVTVQLDA